LGLAALGLVTAPLLVASAAYACTSLANLQANPGSGLAGATITVTGSNFRNTATSGPVEIRLDSRSGPVIASLATSQIDPVGRTISVAVPISADAALGFHTLLATQRDTSTGALLSGFPVRASYMVNGPAARVSSTAATVAPNASATTPAASAASAASADPVAPNSPASDPDPVPAQLVARSADPVVPKISAPSDQPALQPTAPAGASSAAPLTGPATPMALAPVPAAAAPAPASPVATASASPSLTTESSSSGLIPTAASASSSLPGFALLAAVAIVLLSLVASLRSGRSVLVCRRFGTLA